MWAISQRDLEPLEPYTVLADVEKGQIQFLAPGQTMRMVDTGSCMIVSQKCFKN